MRNWAEHGVGCERQDAHGRPRGLREDEKNMWSDRPKRRSPGFPLMQSHSFLITLTQSDMPMKSVKRAELTRGDAFSIDICSIYN